MTFKRTAYAAVPVDADDGVLEKLSGDSGEAIATLNPAPNYKSWVLHLAIFSLYTLAFVGLSVYFFGQKLTETCFLKQSLYSPAHNAVEYSVIRFDGSLDIPSAYKGHPSPAIDEAWNRITTNNSLWPIRVSNEGLEKIKKAGRPSNARFSEADGGGSMGSIEVFHQLHCLNMLRKYTYQKEYPEIQEFLTKRPKFLRSHLDHCIDIIRQNLMCAGDVGIISYDWVTGRKVPLPDFDTYHKCRNFETILDWTTRNRVHIPQEHMRRIGDEVDLPEWHPPD